MRASMKYNIIFLTLLSSLIRWLSLRHSNMTDHHRASHSSQQYSRYGRVSMSEQEKEKSIRKYVIHTTQDIISDACDEAPSICAQLLIICSVILVVVTLPFSLCLVIKVVQVSSSVRSNELILEQEYEKTVIFRLGRILTGGARGPGVFFIIPCVDIYEVIDMRVQNFSVPPQEASASKLL